jgi:hypothetical protein
MTDRGYKPPTCGECAFWRRAEAPDGHCRLLAPWPGADPNIPAHWARTRPEDFCGDWRARNDAAAPHYVTCARCRFWEHIAGGITPVDLADQLPVWWSRAGHCKRSPPRPSALPGNKAFWLATHESDGCFEGKERK